MKFLCPSCKAKYQIADEKVIGRSVKMKCRQCGHIIEIQESVVGASAGISDAPIALSSIPVPAPHKPIPEDMAIRPKASLGSSLAAKAPIKPARLPSTEASAGLPGVGRNLRPPGTGAIRNESPVRATTFGALSTPSAAASRLPAKPPVSGTPHAEPPSERPLARPPVDRSLPSASPFGKSSQEVAHSHSGARVAPIGRVPRTTSQAAPTQAAIGIDEKASAATVAPRRTGEALAEAFTSAVGVAASLSVDQFVGDEWYVGIDDTPVGPIPLTELRARAAQGQVTIDSLVWRDGFEDWKPVRSFPELLAVVEEALSSIQASPGPFSPTVSPADYGPAITLSPEQDR